MAEAMSSRERIVQALEGQPVDRVPFSPFLAYAWEHFPASIQAMGMPAFLREIGADPLWRGAACPASQRTPGVECRSSTRGNQIYEEIITPVGTLQSVVQTSYTGSTSFLIEHPVKTQDDWKVLLWLEEQAVVETADPSPIADIFKEDGLPIGMLIPRGKTAFQSLVEHHVGTEELIYALADYPETVGAVLEVMTANDIQAVQMALDSPYTYFITWEDSSTQNYSPVQYERYIAPEIRQWCQLLATHGKRYLQHACGHVKDLVSMMKRDGVFAVESLSPPPTGNITLRDARMIAGDALGIIGGIEPTELLHLSLDELEPYVERVLSDGAGGPFVLANSDSCPPGVTVEKFVLIGEIVRKRGGVRV